MSHPNLINECCKTIKIARKQIKKYLVLNHIFLAFDIEKYKLINNLKNSLNDGYVFPYLSYKK